MVKAKEIAAVPPPDDVAVDEEIRTYEIRQSSERFRIDIPANWKVTFGPLAPGSKFGSGGYALRVYESETKQRAVFVGVDSFRDLSIPYRKYVKNAKSQSQAMSSDKKRSSSSEVEFSDEWVAVE
jgi:hypothetical protein